MTEQDYIILARPKDYIGVYRIENPVKGVLDGMHALLIPMAIDTEYWQPSFEDLLVSEHVTGRKGVTVQIQGALSGPAMIFTHPDQEAYLQDIDKPIRHPVFRTGFAPVDYLIHCGYPCVLSRPGRIEDMIHLQPIIFRLYAHFALAEYEMVATGDYREDLHRLYFQEKAMMTRRFFLQEHIEGNQKVSDCVSLPWMLEIGTATYRVELSYLDTCAIHGKASYAQFCENVGIELKVKDTMKKLGMIAHMHDAYWQYPEEFDAYAIGDLRVFDAFMANCENTKTLYKALGLLEYYRGEPRPTIGATVRDLFKARIAKLFALEPKDKHGLNSLTTRYLSYATAVHLHKQPTTARLLAKVEGGRCRNNHPTLAHLIAHIIDLDLAGCYGDGQRNQLYPFGVPYIHDYPYNTAQNDYCTLRQFLTARGHGTDHCELVPGLWHARVSLKPEYRLQIPQDFLASWIDYDSAKMAQLLINLENSIVQGSSEDMDYALDVHKGTIKFFTNYIEDAVITHDFVQWVEYIASPKQRDELLDNLYIHAAMFYPASQRVDTIEELLEHTKHHPKKNTSEPKTEDGLYYKEQKHWECHKWYGINLGNFLTESLMIQRKTHKKGTPLNELYKLNVNTLFGVMVSPFFDIGNVTVGNNITARARAACWYMEKGFFMRQSITDGGTFDLNSVVYPTQEDRHIRPQGLVAMYACDKAILNRKHYIRLAPLGGYDRIEVDWYVDHTDLDNDGDPKYKPIFHCFMAHDEVATYVGHDALTWLNSTAMQHLQNLFPHVDVLHKHTTTLTGKPRVGQFEFEAKNIYKEGKFHGSANYELIHHYPKYNVLKMRSYEKKRHYAVKLQDGKLVLDHRYDDATPSKTYMHELETPQDVERGRTFVKERILKPNEYMHHYRHNPEGARLRPGDTVFQAGLLREYSPSQFIFHDKVQWKALQKQRQRDKERVGEYVESYFINDKGNLKYQEMIVAIDTALRNGCTNLIELFDPNNNHRSRKVKGHPHHKTLNETRKFLKQAGTVIPAIIEKLDDALFSSDIDDFWYQSDTTDEEISE